MSSSRSFEHAPRCPSKTTAFDSTPPRLTGEAIRLDADYDGIRIRCRANLGNARIPMQVDVGFGDVVTPAARDIVYPTLLDACDRARCADTCRSQRRSV